MYMKQNDIVKFILFLKKNTKQNILFYLVCTSLIFHLYALISFSGAIPIHFFSLFETMWMNMLFIIWLGYKKKYEYYIMNYIALVWNENCR